MYMFLDKCLFEYKIGLAPEKLLEHNFSGKFKNTL